jgi:hypothetical protein
MCRTVTLFEGVDFMMLLPQIAMVTRMAEPAGTVNLILASAYGKLNPCHKQKVIHRGLKTIGLQNPPRTRRIPRRGGDFLQDAGADAGLFWA